MLLISLRIVSGSRCPSNMCLSRGGFLHGGVTPAGRVHLWLSRVVFGNIGDLGRVEGSACRFRGVLSNCVDPGEMTKKLWRFRIYPYFSIYWQFKFTSRVNPFAFL